MAPARASGLTLLVTALLAAACSGGHTERSRAERTVQQRAHAVGCAPARLAWRRPLPPPAFFPRSLRGLWTRQDGCVYVVFPAKRQARLLWRAPAGERVSGLSWAPNGRTVAVTAGSRVVLLNRDGATLRRVRATGAVFLHDGRLAVSRADGVYLLAGSTLRRLASRHDLEQVAGFRARADFSVSEDPQGFTRGDGNAVVAITLWSAGRSWKSVVLIVSTAGGVVRASPAYRAGGGEGAVYGWAWSPDGRTLFVTAEVAGPTARSQHGDHDHCVDIWTAPGGRRRAFCESQLARPYQSHFAKLVWAAGGKRALLDNGTLVTRSGDVVGRLPLAADDLSFRFQWQP